VKVNLRGVNESDIPRLSAWIAKDSCPQHHDVKPEWWAADSQTLAKPMGSKSIAVETVGGVVFYLKLENVMRCYIQFPPDVGNDKEITKLALKQAFYEISAGAKSLGYHEMIFDSQSKGLINLFGKFGFQEAKDQYSVRL